MSKHGLKAAFLLKSKQNPCSQCLGKAMQLTSESRRGGEWFPTHGITRCTLLGTGLLWLSLKRADGKADRSRY